MPGSARTRSPTSPPGRVPHDVIDFSKAVYGSYAAVQAAMSQSGANVVIGAGADTVTIVGTTVAALVAADFQFH